jgi:serine/threonine protein kinase
MLCYKLPFEADSTHLLYKKIRQGLPSLPEHLSQPARTLLMGMLQVDPDQRMTLPQARPNPARHGRRPPPPRPPPHPARVCHRCGAQVTQSEWLKVGEVEVPQLSQLINAMSLQGELPASAWTRDPIVASRLKFNADGSAEPAPNAPSVRRAFTLPASMLNQDTFLVPDDEREKNFAHEF